MAAYDVSALRAKKDAVDVTTDTSLHAQFRGPKPSAVERALKNGLETILFVGKGII